MLNIVYLYRLVHSDYFYLRFLNSLSAQNDLNKYFLYFVVKGCYSNVDLYYVNNFLKSKCIKHKIVFIEDINFDLGAYHKISSDYPSNYFLFLNSYSYFIHNSSLNKIFLSFLKLPINSVLGTSFSYSTHGYRNTRNVKSYYILHLILYFYWNCMKIEFYPNFPNPHIRTNGFVCNSNSVIDYFSKTNLPRNKDDCHQIESGLNSFTNYFKNVFVIYDSNLLNILYPHPYNAFRRGDQSELLIKDNQADHYDRSTKFKKLLLTIRSWPDYA